MWSKAVISAELLNSPIADFTLVSGHLIFDFGQSRVESRQEMGHHMSLALTGRVDASKAYSLGMIIQPLEWT